MHWSLILLDIANQNTCFVIIVELSLELYVSFSKLLKNSIPQKCQLRSFCIYILGCFCWQPWLTSSPGRDTDLCVNVRIIQLSRTCRNNATKINKNIRDKRSWHSSHVKFVSIIALWNSEKMNYVSLFLSVLVHKQIEGLIEIMCLIGMYVFWTCSVK